ncbi:MAG: hypothetical protein AAB412_04305, partial [Elusimicrobiota bacterium]
ALLEEQGRLRAGAEDEHRARLDALRRREEDLDKDTARIRNGIEAEFNSRQIKAQLDSEDKERRLEDAFQKRTVELQERFLGKEKALGDDWTRRKMELLEEHEAAVEAERASLSAQAEQKSRALEESYAARVVELERTQAVLEDQYRSWKDAALSEVVLKEKNLDSQWHAREQELVRRYEAALEQERRSSALERDKTKAQYETQLKTAEQEMFARSESMRLGYERMEAELADGAARREDGLRAAHQEELAGLRERHDQALSAQGRHFENEQLRRAGEHALEVKSIKEKHQARVQDLEKILAEKDLELLRVRELSQKAQQEKAALWEELQGRETKLQAERLSMEEAQKAREAQREEKYLALERRLQEIWTSKERDFLLQHEDALSVQARKFAADVQGIEAERQREREAHARALAGLEAGLQARFEEWKKEASVETGREKEAWMERQRRALIREREALQEQGRSHLDTLNAEGLQRERDLAKRREALEGYFRRKEEESAEGWRAKEKRFIEEQQETLAKERAALDALYRGREETLHANYLALEGELKDSWAHREQIAAADMEDKLRQALKVREEESQRKAAQWEQGFELRKAAELEALREALQEDYDRRSLELEKRQTQVEKEAREKEARLDSAHLQKEQALESQWKVREGELLAKVEEERAAYRARVKYETDRRQGEARDAQMQREALFEKEKRRLSEESRLEVQKAKELLEKQDAEWFERKKHELAQESERLHEQHRQALEVAASEGQSREKDLEVRRLALEAYYKSREEALLQELRQRELKGSGDLQAQLSKERTGLDKLYRDREETLQRTYLQLETELKADWAQKEEISRRESETRLGLELKAFTERMAQREAQWEEESRLKLQAAMEKQRAQLQSEFEKRLLELEREKNSMEARGREKESSAEKAWLQRRAELESEFRARETAAQKERAAAAEAGERRRQEKE